MGKRKVIIELEFLLSVFPIESCLEHCPRHASPKRIGGTATHESRFGIISNMMVDWVARQVN